MKINVNDYILSKRAIQQFYLKFGNNDPVGTVAVAATSTMVPCIVTAFYIGEVSGWTEKLLAHINMLIKFYGYTKIEGMPESYPGEKV